MLLWRKYITLTCIKSYFFIFFCLFCVFVLFDFSMHASELSLTEPGAKKHLVQYYFCQLSKRQMILAPLSFILALIATITKFSLHNELLALQAAGLAKKKLMQPFLVIAFFISCCQLINYEFVLPSCYSSIEKFEQLHLKSKKKHKHKKSLQVLPLDDGSRLVYQKYLHNEQSFFDVYWIKSTSDIWRMHELYTKDNALIGTQAMHLVRGAEGFELQEHHEQKEFTDFAMRSSLPKKGFIPLKAQAISALAQQFGSQKKFSVMQQKAILTHLCFKLSISLLSLLFCVAIIPYCLHYRRGGSSIFLIFSLSLFSFIALLFMMNSFLILGEANIASPIATMLIPLALLFFLLGIKLRKTLTQL